MYDIAALLRGIRTAAPTANASTYSLSWHERPAWLTQALADIVSLQRLRANWDSYGAAIIRTSMLQAAADLLSGLAQPETPSPAVVPTADGSLQLEWHTRGIDLEVRWLSPTRIHVYLEDLRGHLDALDDELEYDVRTLKGAIRELSART